MRIASCQSVRIIGCSERLVLLLIVHMCNNIARIVNSMRYLTDSVLNSRSLTCSISLIALIALLVTASCSGFAAAGVCAYAYELQINLLHLSYTHAGDVDSKLGV